MVLITANRPSAPRKPGAAPDREYDEFFEKFMRSLPSAPVNRPRSIGSGVIIDADGYVLTAEHIVEATDVITARLADGRVLAAKLVGKDRRGGVALLKIDAAGLAAAAAGDPRKLRLAERVFALGGVPGGRTPAVTDGIVSALEVDESNAAGYLQTTVPLYPTMGGGPLFNLEGEVVGINAMLYSRTTSGGISYALPIDEAMAVAKELRASGRVRRGTLGVTVQDVPLEVAATYGMEIPAGALIQEVSSASPAAQAGIAAGDVVTRFEGQAVRSALHLTRLVGRTRPGDRVTLRVRRGKDAPERDLAVVLAEAPER